MTLPAMPHMTAQGLSLLSYTYGCLERRPPRAWLAALYGAAAGVSPPGDVWDEAATEGSGEELPGAESPGAEASGGDGVGGADSGSAAASAYVGLARFNALGLERLLWGIAKVSLLGGPTGGSAVLWAS